MSDHRPPVWTIRPEPTDEELVALMTTLTVGLNRQAAPTPPTLPSSGAGSRWARAGRIAALTRWPPPTGRGWGQEAPGAGRS